jgi:tetratricopeptide (TPR) repeat protein
LAAKRPQPPRLAPRPRHALFIGALWIAALAAYSNSFHAGLAFDSQRVILADSRIQADTPDNVRQIWTGDYYNGTGSGALYRPLTTLTYLWNYAGLGDGPNASGYHAFNFALHAANAALVYLLALAIFRVKRPSEVDPGEVDLGEVDLGEAWPAFAMAALWALHPILTESVTNVVGRADLLAAFGILAGLLSYLRSAATTGWRSIAWTVALAASAYAGIFSKESGVVLIAVMIAYEAAFATRVPWRVRIAGYLAVLLPAAAFFAMRKSALVQVSSLLISYCDNPLQGAGFLISRLTAIKVLGAYLWLLLWPARLSPDYSYNQIPLSTGADIPALLALLVWIAIAAAAVLAYRRARPALFFIAFFAVTIAPVANLVILVGSIMAERFLYLPSIAFAGVLVWGALAVRRRVPVRSMAIALAAVCTAFAARTWTRNADWFDDRTLWASAAQVAPQSYKAHQNLAMLALAQPQPDYPTATREVERALAILDPLPDDRSMPNVYATAGQCYRARGDLSRALAVLLRGRNIDRAWNTAFQERNRLDGKTVGAVGTPPLYLELGRVYVDLGQPDKALEVLREGRQIDPQPAFFEEMSRAYSGMGQPAQAAVSLLEGVTVYSTQSAVVSELTRLYRPTGADSCELTPSQAGVTLNINCPQVHTLLCAAARNMVDMFTQMHDASSAGAIAQSAQNYGCGR